MSAFSLCGIALLAFAALEIIGKEKSQVGTLVAIAGMLCLLTPAVLSLTGLLETLNQKLAEYHFEGGEALFRAFGIGLCCEITGDICRDAGRQGLSNALDFSCKVALLLLCIPMWKQLFSLVEELLP